MPRSTIAEIVLLVGSIAVSATAAEPIDRPLERRFEEVVQPFLKNHCLSCHGSKKQAGAEIRPTRKFPVFPANEAGFDNSGESLTMSPELVNKYLAAARQVADHLVLKPDGFDFAPHSVVTDTDRDKYCVQRIIEFY